MRFLEQLKDDIVFLRGALARAADDDADRQESDAGVSRGDRGARRQIRRRAGADLRPRAASAIARSPSAPTAMRAGRWREKLAKGDTVCLLMPNRPEYMAAWIGITRAGGVAALINTNLIGTALAHCIDIVAPKHIIVAAELADGFATARPLLKTSAEDLVARRERRVPAHRPRDRRPARRSRSPPSERRGADHRGPRALHLHLRHHRPAQGRQHQPLPRDAGELRLRRRDGHASRPTACTTACRCITPPAALVATGAVLLNGGSVVIREKFSAREFWDDVVRYDCTLFQYIGELCRYLVQLAAEPERDASTSCGSPAATACGPTSGTSSRRASAFRTSSNSTARPKAT